MTCKNCGKTLPIVNKHFCLCVECNNLRLHGNKYGKIYTSIKKDRKSYREPKRGLKTKSRRSLFVPKMIEKKSRQEKILEDEIFYEKCFNKSDHKCEECGEQLPEIFRDDDGKIIARWRYSHVVAKSLAENLRHKISNINHLCLKCHQRWDFGDRENMKIFAKNLLIFPHYLNT